MEEIYDGDIYTLTDETGEETLVTIDDDDEFDRVADYFEDELFNTVDYDEDGNTDEN